MAADGMIHCPKCGFQQPVDTYCASCGVDMTKLPKPRPPLFKQPAVLAGLGIATVALGAIAVKLIGPGSTSLNEFARSSNSGAIATLMRASRGVKPAAPAAAPAAPTQETVAQPLSPPVAVAGTAATETRASLQARSTVADKVGADASTNESSGEKGKQTSVVYISAEASREWLAMLGASAVGTHVVDGLEAKLRSGSGMYQLHETQRAKAAAESGATTEPVVLKRERISLAVTPQSVSAQSAVFAVEPHIVSRTGAPVASTPGSVQIERGYGAIVTMESAGGAQSPSVPVFFIVPRWEETGAAPSTTASESSVSGKRSLEAVSPAASESADGITPVSVPTGEAGASDAESP